RDPRSFPPRRSSDLSGLFTAKIGLGPLGHQCLTPDKVSHKIVGRSVVQAIWRIPLDNDAFLHDTDAICNRKRLGLVMRYEQGGVAGGFQDIAYLEGKAFARIDVQIGEGLVQKQKVRLGCKSAGKGNTLLLS